MPPFIHLPRGGRHLNETRVASGQNVVPETAAAARSPAAFHAARAPCPLAPSSGPVSLVAVLTQALSRTLWPSLKAKKSLGFIYDLQTISHAEMPRVLRGRGRRNRS